MKEDKNIAKENAAIEIMISKRVRALPESPTLALAAKAKELKSEGKDVISLAVGEPDWGTLESAKVAGKMAIDQNMTKYTPASGMKELREAIAQQASAQYNMNFNFQQVTISSGAKFMIYSALSSILNPGDEALIPTPFWASYPSIVQLAGGLPKFISTTSKNRFKITPQELNKAITPQTKVFMFNSPSNPTGQIYTKRELQALVDILVQHPHIIILSDDIYSRLIFTEDHCAPHFLQIDQGLAPRLIIVNGASKSFAMTGWRMGWALGPLEIIQAMGRFQSQATGCASSISQAATLGALKNSDEEFKRVLVELKDKMAYAVQAFSQIHGLSLEEPEGAFYLWVDIHSYLSPSSKKYTFQDSREFASELLKSQSVVVVPGADFGQEGFIRVSFAVEKQKISQAASRIQAFLK